MRTWRILTVALALGVAGGGGAGVANAEGIFSRLYAARPPVGSSFVRVVNPGGTPMRAQVAGGPAQTLAGEKVASTYAIVKGNDAFPIVIDGKPAGTLQVAPDTFNTLVPRREGGKVTFTVLTDAGGTQDGLKAELRFYNLSANCAAGQLRVSPSGPMLFDGVAQGASVARAINPVKATLVSACGSATTKTLALPALEPGDHYSLFLVGTDTAPVLRGQLSATDTYQR
ncbi:alginate O-acetyltransferase AlgF [Pandoraea nosoerga]|uniref:Alginate biosynthesis protein AlgF n=1 Tax=Pandoraea nosoerga TaxID=2508296 RepID=A0A5E4VUC8_9BURK|nr:alginate O-acetyltransferase AlgF [Pandoraea nosoerga]MBN4667976.1 alginate O-acetyltransferase AlgF [Pandoraea nosoerga]MBN4677878.1 alginate O-acetyltransferase AlgF [Pandoraea nosoerga]MBN4683065.1 alginate O-acetyltransferase AlgF [Pandoraea nosoerga]MBN4747038.1 alginate O-acetyltransferase AlgF [Pandoraea nosoerga]VVE15169.1 cell division protein FtsQ [Pandoraea nosoerga]